MCVIQNTYPLEFREMFCLGESSKSPRLPLASRSGFAFPFLETCVSRWSWGDFEKMRLLLIIFLLGGLPHEKENRSGSFGLRSL